MNVFRTALAIALCALVPACGKSDPGAPPLTPATADPAASSSSAAADAPAPDPSVAPVASSSATPATSASPASAAAPGDASSNGESPAFAFVLPQAEGKGMCLTVTLSPEKLAAFNKDRKAGIADFAKQLKAPKATKFMDACPTDQVVGTCLNGFGMLVSYYPPQYTTDSAKKNCTGKQGGSWVK